MRDMLRMMLFTVFYNLITLKTICMNYEVCDDYISLHIVLFT